ncbi:MAG: hypothetical protein ACK5JR_03735 [Tropicimonas sp.]|uniref:hypothetical protein n=1 Tax=Tropicimonas sp. TaxID=2067044 RepID=UPI003A865D5D
MFQAKTNSGHDTASRLFGIRAKRAEAGERNRKTEEQVGFRLLLIALATVFLYHGGLLPFTHVNSYDAFIHMFFGDHYHRSWFDPWEPRWYTGFATTSYPPGTHMAIAALMHLVPMRAAFVLVQLAGLMFLTVGVYRFALLWVTPRAAGFAALALALSSSIAQTTHLFGQLPTICSLGMFLNGLPYIYRWIVVGRPYNLLASLVFAAATTALHHVTTIFGGALFVIPLAVQALRAVAGARQGRAPPGTPRWLRPALWARPFAWPFARGLLLAGLMLGAILLTVFPYWQWSVSDPITQVPIPHGSRENFLVRTDLGLVFFVMPWGVGLLFLPYCIYKTASTRMWPLGLSALMCFVLGTGGTTPIPRMLLRGAFDILTLDRFTFWATILILPFAGLMLESLIFGRSGRIVREVFGRGADMVVVGGIFAALTVASVGIAVLPTIRPSQPPFVDPMPIVRFLEQDNHSRWRYLTLGFGDQFAYLSALSTAQSVDGNYHSARRLPELTRHAVERLENAKFNGVAGLGSLRQFVENAERYHLKYIFSNDAFYDPLLYFSGWNRLTRLQNGIVIWEKPDISPLPLFEPRREIPRIYALMWGTLPPLAMSLALIVFVAGCFHPDFRSGTARIGPVTHSHQQFRNARLIRRVVLALGLLSATGAASAAILSMEKAHRPLPAQGVVEHYFDALDTRQFTEAYALLDPQTRGEFDNEMFNWSWVGGLITAYGKLQSIDIRPVEQAPDLADWHVGLHWLTSLDTFDETRMVRTVRRDGRWHVVPLDLRPIQTPVRLQRQNVVAWNVVGRRQPLPYSDLHRDRMDRPRLAISGARLVRKGERYHVVGQVTNTDTVPAAATVFSELYANGTSLAWQAMGHVAGNRLLPAESSGFRIDFEGVLSLDDARANGEFDPAMYIPPELPMPPQLAVIEARSVVSTNELYRGIGLNNLRPVVGPDGITITGQAVNTSTEIATLARVTALLFDLEGKPVWADAGFVEQNIFPGQSTPFTLHLPPRDRIKVIEDIPSGDIGMNGASLQPDMALPDAASGTIPLDPSSGYSAVRLDTSVMIYDPLF